MKIRRVARPGAGKIFPLLSVLTIILILAGCQEEGPPGPPGPPGGADDLSNPLVMPRVIFTNPAHNSVGPFRLYDNGENASAPHFVLRFNKLMAKASFDSGGITIEGFDRPVFVEVFRRTNPWPWLERTGSELYDDVLEFRILDAEEWSIPMYRVGRTISVTIHPRVEDINGNRLSGAYTFAYTPEPGFRATAFRPKDGANDVGQTQTVTLTFNSKVNENILPSLAVLPSALGRWVVRSDSQRVTFERGQPMPFGSSHSVQVSGGARDIFGNPIVQPYVVAFRVVTFRIGDFYPQDGAVQVSLRPYLWVWLTGNVDTGTVRQAFTIAPPRPGAFSIGTQSFRYDVASALAPNTRHTVTITQALRAADGTPLQNPVAFSFTTDQFRVTYTDPNYGQAWVPRNALIRVHCNAELDTASIRSAFSISPAVSGIFSASPTSPVFTFTPSGLLAPNQLYTVTISSQLRMQGGYALSSPYSFVFTTRP